ncbi:putative secreted protein [Bacillus cereus]|nr:putative secreted protein [Bacillus cereus]
MNSKKNVAQYIAGQIEYPFCIFKEYPDLMNEKNVIFCW